VDGEVVSKHRTKEVAVEAGRAIARKVEVEHTIHRSDGVITEKKTIRVRQGTASEPFVVGAVIDAAGDCRRRS
jgi:hypothetical protein